MHSIVHVLVNNPTPRDGLQSVVPELGLRIRLLQPDPHDVSDRKFFRKLLVVALPDGQELASVYCVQNHARIIGGIGFTFLFLDLFN